MGRDLGRAGTVARVLLGYAVPMSLLPAVAWVTGSLLFPDDIGGAAAARSTGQILFSGLWTFVGSLLTVVVLAGALSVVAPAYGLQRRWADAVRVAAYGCTPFWIAGVLLVKPVLVVALVSRRCTAASCCRRVRASC